MDLDNHLIEIKINSYDELINLICGKLMEMILKRIIIK